MVKANDVFLNGKIYCVVPKNKFIEAFAVKDGKFIAVGSNEEIQEVIDNNTNVHDLNGNVVIPGLHDMHIHALMGGLQSLNECELPTKGNMEDILKAIKEYVEKNPEKEWIVGGKWEPGLMSEMTKEKLDGIESERPIVLFDFSHHNAWVNSKALEIANINRDTPNPSGGEILMNIDGEPSGLLIEHAIKLVDKHIPKYTQEQYDEAAEWVVKHLNSLGITSFKDPNVDRQTLRTYKKLDDKNKLTARIATCLMWKYSSDIPFQDQFDLIAERKKYETDKINVDFAKMFVDGVPAFKTGSFVDAYEGDDPNEHRLEDMLLLTEQEIKEDLLKLDKDGITVKFHASGDGSVRTVLNAIEYVRKNNGNSGLSHEIAHSGFIHKNDINRYEELNAVAEFSPPLWFPSELHEKTKVNLLGKERADNHFIFKTMINTKANTVAASDWPVSRDPNPWPALEAIITRKNPYENYPGVLNENERLDVISTIELYTINSAKTMYTENETGSIEVGKYADFIELDRDIFEIEDSEIRNTRIQKTFVAGSLVYQNE